MTRFYHTMKKVVVLTCLKVFKHSRMSQTRGRLIYSPLVSIKIKVNIAFKQQLVKIHIYHEIMPSFWAFSINLLTFSLTPKGVR